jgi:hypothetical protein
MSDRKKKEEVNISDDDPYASVAAEKDVSVDSTSKESARSRKWNQFWQKLEMAKAGMYQSFLMGSMVGGGFGLVFGLYNAITYKSFLVLPIAVITSGASFGFFMACGSLIRTSPMNYGNLNPNLMTYNPLTNRVEEVPLWKMKYMNSV